MNEFTNMTIGQLCGSLAGVLAGLSLFIEIAPIKLHPISAFLRWLGRKLNGDLDQRLDKLSKKVEQMKSEDEERDAIACRIRILQFGDELRRGLKHSQEHFIQILDDISNYNDYCKAHPKFLNERTVLTVARIKEVYSKCLSEDDFL